MDHPILLVNYCLNIDQLPDDFAKQYVFETVADGKSGLARLAAGEWRAVLAAAELPDMRGLDFLARATACSDAVPLLMVPDANLATCLVEANNCSVFRTTTESAPATALTAVFRDAVRQFDLIRREREQRRRIEQLTTTDPLTGCLSRPHLEEQLKKELSRSIRYGHHLSVILCDLDGLQTINESVGRGGGDQVLTSFADAARSLIRQDIDAITRWGEDEFLLTLPETPIRGAGRVAARLREQFAALDCGSDGQQVRCTASFGVAGFAPDNAGRNAQLDDLLLIAGRCLLQAKAAGGNQVLCCP